jgi:hypothetical protein
VVERLAYEFAHGEARGLYGGVESGLFRRHVVFGRRAKAVVVVGQRGGWR